MITFEEFRESALANGYQAKQESGRPELFTIKTRNNIKSEINIKARTYIAGYNLSPEKRIVLREHLSQSKQFKMAFPERKLAYAEYAGLEKFWNWVSIVEGIDLNTPPIETEIKIVKNLVTKTEQTPMVTFADFESASAARGYKAKIQYGRPELFVIKSKNGVKVEINTKSRSYIAGYQLDNEEMIALKSELCRQQELGIFRLKFSERKLAYAEYEGLDKFWQWTQVIENIEAIIASTRGLCTKVFSKAEAEDKIFEKIAKTYQFALRNQHQNLLDTSRVLLEADKLDHLITVGKSVNAPEDNPYREHVVPCVLIHNEAIKQFIDNGVLDNEVSPQVIKEISCFIQSNLAIVLISREEQNLLDVQMGLRTSMPKNWKFGDNIYARLELAEIEWDTIDGD